MAALPNCDPQRRSLLESWHLLSLDAPSVAALWTWFMAWCAGVHLAIADPLAMFVAVWMLYATDRLLDARPLANGFNPPELEERHRFHHQHRSRFLPALVIATGPLAYLLHRLASPVLHLYAVLAALLVGWLLLVHLRTAPFTAARLPKELAVGLFFPAAVFIPTVARAPGLRLPLLAGALLFAGICTLNCLFLYAWEHPGNETLAHGTTRLALRRLPLLAYLLLLASSAVALLAIPGIWLPPTIKLAHVVALPLACALSAAILLLLHATRRRFPALRLRALADVALLTPLLPMLVVAISRFKR